MKIKKLYKVGIGLAQEAKDITDWRSKNVVARDVPEAIRKVRLRKDEYIEDVFNIQKVDIA